MSKERELLERWVMQNNFAEYYALREETVTFLAQPEDDQYYNHIKEHKEQIEADFKEHQSEEKWYANSLGDNDE